MASKGRPYRTFVIEGFEVLVGRADEDNDHLTFRIAEPWDLWLHVAGGTPGSHVVVRNPEKIARLVAIERYKTIRVKPAAFDTEVD